MKWKVEFILDREKKGSLFDSLKEAIDFVREAYSNYPVQFRFPDDMLEQIRVVATVRTGVDMWYDCANLTEVGI